MSSSGTVPNGADSNSNDTSSLKDEIGDDSILNRVDSETSSLQPAFGGKRMSQVSDVMPMNKIGTFIPKGLKLEKGNDEEDDGHLNMPENPNFMRRGTVFESLIGGFGSINIGDSNKDSSFRMVGDTKSK